MVSKKSILLILKQKPGIAYPELLASVLADYANVNSARAALSRALREMQALGLVVKKENRLFITDKGIATLAQEMRNRLILKLSKSIEEENVFELVKLLSVLIERSKADSELLKIARDSVKFHLRNLRDIQKETERKAKQLIHISEVLEKQIEILESLGFRDSFTIKREKFLLAMMAICKIERISVLTLTADKETLSKLQKELGISALANAAQLNISKLKKLAKFLETTNSRISITANDFLVNVADSVKIVSDARKIKMLATALQI